MAGVLCSSTGNQLPPLDRIGSSWKAFLSSGKISYNLLHKVAADRIVLEEAMLPLTLNLEQQPWHSLLDH
ncbi:hypothetical protein SLEP1_g58984 [Rubroshorea leprosula]|uniref:Uncharacterized protein n=1 Tax=Rubroshorea leprosula TaxID=152421 RepID=A0AAV5MS36_9ROSI|nr:hypothetical protein SLEP1_g58984 [Rubroshorea leprosula]